MNGEDGKVIDQTQTQTTGRDLSPEDLGERLAERLLQIPKVRNFARAIRSLHGMSGERVARSFMKKISEGL